MHHSTLTMYHRQPFVLALLLWTSAWADGGAPAPSNRPWAVFDTGSPPDAFGTDGFDVSRDQSVAMRFIASAGGPLQRIELYLMSNTDGSPPQPSVEVQLVVGSAAAPSSGKVLERFLGVPVTAVGFQPVLVQLKSMLQPNINVGDMLWVVLSSNNSAQSDGVWCMSNSLAFGATTAQDGTWQPGASGNAAAVSVWAASAPPSVKK